MKDLELIIEKAASAAIALDPKCHATKNYDGSKVAEVCKQYNLSHEDTMAVYAAVEKLYDKKQVNSCQGKPLIKMFSTREDCKNCDR